MFAAPQAAPVAHPGGISGLAEVTLALLLVLCVIFARAVLLRVGATQILLGVAPGRVNALYVLPEPLSLDRAGAAPSGPPPPSFRALLMKSLGK